MNEIEFLKGYNIHDYEIPLCSVDTVIFSLIESEINVLLVKRDEHPCKDLLALPGGFIDLKRDESSEASAHRKLTEKTGITSAYLEQIETIGSPIRDPRGWSITILYFALIDATKVSASKLGASSLWMPISKLKNEKIGFDHKDLIDKAMSRLRAKATYTALPIELMPNEFTLSELQNVFSVIMGRELQPKAFRKRVIDAGMVKETGKSKISGKRPAKLYASTNLDRDTYFSRPLQE